MRLECRSLVMMPLEPAGRPWAARCSRSPPSFRCGSADTFVVIVRSAPRSGRGSQPAGPLLPRLAPSRAIPGTTPASVLDGSCGGSRRYWIQVKAAWHYMDQETLDELLTREGHCLLAVVIPVVLPAEADLAVIHGHQSVVNPTSRIRPRKTRYWPGSGSISNWHPMTILSGCG